MQHFSRWKYYHPYISPFDPCPPIKVKAYSTPPHLYMGFQPEGLQQYQLREALYAGTLWPALYDPYEGIQHKEKREG
ncbi:spore coat associated protein CotJA [Desertibacillus haloalkaliphilus]|uniref:spore coat associated protein CotJA n=1 Tax=Desertibacillus haloalkaliphilus TaxID=1328930 RepID=UPI001C269C13|nr:spore coat associated protein CotJA [Desertibacillus haloalkaliphilus]MBU8905394.1 spore coat associated protein CotJA [Desertibacillus haloalkaliphilus]